MLLSLTASLAFAISTFCPIVLADPKAVFTHFIVGNANGNSIDDWTDDIQKAKCAHIDGFALNIASQDNSNGASLSNAFQAANNVGNFKLFLSFDYAAEGAFSSGTVVSLINQWAANGAYFRYNNQPLVNTFEGTQNSGDWSSIKQQTNCFFMPDWSSIGASAAVGTGVVDGLLSWEAWPNGASDMTTGADYTYTNALGAKPYMMPVSPWFYTNLPGYKKNWLWRGDHMWYDRWQQIFTINPALVMILTWNDYGESHYIGPIRSNDLGLFQSGGAPFDYATNSPHDGWRTFLPYVIDTYKNGAAPSVSSEQLTTWYRVNPSSACGTGGTTGNTASQGQQELPPGDVSEDEVFYSALLQGDADVTVTIGSSVQSGTWRNSPEGGIGIYHGSVPFNGGQGPVTVSISRNGKQVTQVTGTAITTSCEAGLVNWNAWVGVS